MTLVQEVGLKQLLTTYKDETCLRQFLASIVLLGYHLFLTNHMGQVPGPVCNHLKNQGESSLKAKPHYHVAG